MPRNTSDNKAGSGTTRTTRRKTTKSTTPRKRTATRKAPTRLSDIIVAPDERRRLIAEAAYLRAEARGFVGGDPTMDWLEAEREIDARITQS